MANNSFIHRSKTYQLFVVVLTSLLAALGGVFLCLGGVYSSLVLGIVGGAAIIGSCIGAFGLVSYLLSVIRNSDQLLQEAKESARKISNHYRVLETQKNREIGLLEERVNMLDGFYAKFHGWD